MEAYKNKTADELQQAINEKVCELGALEFSEEKGSPSREKTLKREIARMKTLLNEKSHQEKY